MKASTAVCCMQYSPNHRGEKAYVREATGGQPLKPNASALPGVAKWLPLGQGAALDGSPEEIKFSDMPAPQHWGQPWPELAPNAFTECSSQCGLQGCQQAQPWLHPTSAWSAELCAMLCITGCTAVGQLLGALTLQMPTHATCLDATGHVGAS